MELNSEDAQELEEPRRLTAAGLPLLVGEVYEHPRRRWRSNLTVQRERAIRRAALLAVSLAVLCLTYVKTRHGA